MIDRTLNSFSKGITRVKWIATFLADRTKAETSMAKDFYKRSKLESRMDDLYRDVGKRVVELNEKGGTDVFSDPVIKDALIDLQGVKKNIGEYRRQAENVSATQGK